MSGRVVLGEPTYEPSLTKSSTALKLKCELALNCVVNVRLALLNSDLRPTDINGVWLEVLLTKSAAKPDCNVFARFGEYWKSSFAAMLHLRLKTWVVTKSTLLAVKSL